MTILTNEFLKSFEISISSFDDSQTLPPEIYTSEEFLDFERKSIFDQEWLCVGLASSVPDPGDWLIGVEIARNDGEGTVIVDHNIGA